MQAGAGQVGEVTLGVLPGVEDHRHVRGGGRDPGRGGNRLILGQQLIDHGGELGDVRPAAILTFTHVTNTGAVIKAVTKDVSGPTTVTSDPKPPYPAQFVGDGSNWLAFGPNGRKNTGEPGLVFTLGHVVVDSIGKNPATATSFSLTGPDSTQEDGCQDLAGP